MSYCPFIGGLSGGAYICLGCNCALSDPVGNCLIKKYLEAAIEKKEFTLAAKKRELDEQREKYLNATKILD